MACLQHNDKLGIAVYYEASQEPISAASIVTSKETEKVCAAGALVTILQKQGILHETFDDQETHGCTYYVCGLKEIGLDGFLMVDSGTLQALQIFAEDKHPSCMGIGSTKEGFSVYNMLNKCITNMGRRMLKIWMLRPIVDLDAINERLGSFKSSRHTNGVNDRMKRRRIGAPPAEQPPSGIERLASFHASDELLACQSLIADIIDFDQEDDNMMIHYNICSQLDDLKISYHGLPSLLTKIVERELQRVPRELRTQLKQHLWSILYMPQVGFVLRLDGMHLTADLDDHLPDFQLAFEGNAESTFGTYYHTDSTRQLNARFGDMKMKIRDLEVAICNSLLSRLQRFSPFLSQATDFAAELDCMASLAMAARDFHLTRPVLTQENRLDIKQGRHLLTEAVANTYIPADVEVSEHDGRIQVVTGPNMSGKSCYAKQVALIVFLAHIGSFVPAKSATIGLTDRILTRVPIQDSQCSMQSTFMADLTQVAAMLQQATSRSLCIIDEFGKGTLNADGVGLLCGTLQHLNKMTPAPMIFACTHFSEVFLQTCLPRSRNITFKTMQVMSDSEDTIGSSSKDIVFLYRAAEGHSLPSYGVHCARLAGVPDTILKRASQVLQLRQDGSQINELHSAKLQSRQRMILELAKHLSNLQISSQHDVALLMGEAMQISVAPGQISHS
ncbi:hypothetical protein WJX84_005856 [Apatococcus fuscideae]|uniref:DNA mismatch repair protein MSH5 n=1 Tax=Apatococcus fuscideae TaxID=2026836 RepID=A0AAW1SM75_9CHLO